MGPEWEAWVSGLVVSRTRALQYALLHLLRYDRDRGPVPITSTTRFPMRYFTPREWQGSREEYLWRIEQYLNWLGIMYGDIDDWTAWAVPAMFTQEHIDVLHHEDARYGADVVTYMAWHVAQDEDEYESDDASSGGNRNWDTAPTGEPEGEPATVDHGTLCTWVQGNPSRTLSPALRGDSFRDPRTPRS